MSVPDGQVVPYHLQGRLKDRLISLRLPELDIETVAFVADSSISFSNLSHVPYAL